METTGDSKKICSLCGEAARVGGTLCGACYMYKRKTGKDRPWYVIERYRERKRSGKTVERKRPLFPSVYTFLDANGVALYVGMTGHGYQRIKKHSGIAEWWHRVSTITVIHATSRDEAYDIEALLVDTLYPVFNDRTKCRGLKRTKQITCTTREQAA